MTTTDREKDIRDMKEQLKALPAGSIARKKINGKNYFYHRHRVDGKIRDVYLKTEEVEPLRKKIEERKSIEKKISSLKDKPCSNYITNVRTGRPLDNFAVSTSKFRRRDGINNLQDYISGDYPGKVFILYGLRRTGKTTLISQMLYEMKKEREHAAYIKVSRDNTLHELNTDIKKLERKGYKYIFIDEVTLLEDFIENASLFSDIYATSGIKIILSGTDSLGFLLTEDDELFDRTITLHTTFIPFREFSSVLGIDDIDEYIRYGGTMCTGGTYYNGKPRTFRNKDNADFYVNQAIAENIQHSLKYYQHGTHFRSLANLYKNGELTGAINRVVEDINHNFTVEVLTRDFVSSDFAISRNNLEKDRKKPSDILYRVDLPSITRKMMDLLKIKNRQEQKIDITDGMAREIEAYLKLMDLIYYIDVVSSENTNNVTKRVVIAQPGLRYAQAEALILSLIEDNYMREIPIEERDWVKTRILSEIQGRMLEDIVLMETQISSPDKKVFVLKFPVGEFDMVIFDSEGLCCELFEIKHSNVITENQYRHLVDEEKCRTVTQLYGKIKSKTVLYRGETTSVDGICYVNVEEYLKALPPPSMVTL